MIGSRSTEVVDYGYGDAAPSTKEQPNPSQQTVRRGQRNENVTVVEDSTNYGYGYECEYGNDHGDGYGYGHDYGTTSTQNETSTASNPYGYGYGDGDGEDRRSSSLVPSTSSHVQRRDRPRRRGSVTKYSLEATQQVQEQQEQQQQDQHESSCYKEDPNVLSTSPSSVVTSMEQQYQNHHQRQCRHQHYHGNHDNEHGFDYHTSATSTKEYHLYENQEQEQQQEQEQPKQLTSRTNSTTTTTNSPPSVAAANVGGPIQDTFWEKCKRERRKRKERRKQQRNKLLLSAQRHQSQSGKSFDNMGNMENGMTTKPNRTKTRTTPKASVTVDDKHYDCSNHLTTYDQKNTIRTPSLQQQDKRLRCRERRLSFSS